MMEEEGWASFYDYAPEPGTYEHAKGYDLIDPNVDLIIGENGDLFAPARPQYPDHEQPTFKTYEGPYAPRFYGDPPTVAPYTPDESMYDFTGPTLEPPEHELQEMDPWGPPLGPPPEDQQETMPGFPPVEDDPGSWFELPWEGLTPDLIPGDHEWPGELKEKYEEGWEGTFDAPFFDEGEFDLDPGEGTGLPGEGTLGGLPEIGAMTGMIGALVAMTIIPKLLDR